MSHASAAVIIARVPVSRVGWIRAVTAGSLSVGGNRSNSSKSGSCGEPEAWHSAVTMRRTADVLAGLIVVAADVQFEYGVITDDVALGAGPDAADGQYRRLGRRQFAGDDGLQPDHNHGGEHDRVDGGLRHRAVRAPAVPVLDHPLGAVAQLLGRLKERDHRAGPLLAGGARVGQPGVVQVAPVRPGTVAGRPDDSRHAAQDVSRWSVDRFNSA